MKYLQKNTFEFDVIFTRCFFPLVSIPSERLGDTEARGLLSKSKTFILIFIWKVTFPLAV